MSSAWRTTSLRSDERLGGTVKIRYGDVFSEPADLAVLPCATDGQLTDFVRRTREDLNLPGPPRELELASLQLFHLAVPQVPIRWLAYAAARDNAGSSPDILREIGRKVGALTVGEQAITVVAAPIIGSGAGRVPLVPAIQAFVEGFRLVAAPHAVLSLCAPRRNSFSKVEVWYSSWMVETRTPPRVFLSYNQATQASWVKGLHEFLKSQGIDAVVDRWELKLMMDLKEWMAQEISRADKVVIISDEAYARKADMHEGGVGEETSIIEIDLKRPAPPEKYIAVIRSQSAAAGTPAYLRGRFVVHCSSDDQTARVYQQILRALHGEGHVAPPFGERPIYL